MTTSNYLFDLLGVRDRLVMDPVHGGISLFPHEVATIDHPLFQRLRHICQNDILSLVFPGATHSRFLHSIGTLHVGSRMYQGLIESALKRHQAKGRALVDCQLAAISHFAQVVRLACLLHDIGHSSFSHQFAKSRTIHELLSQEGRFEQLWCGLSPERFYTKTPTRLEHEHYSVRCAYEILYTSTNPDLCRLRDDVMALLETTEIRPSELCEKHALALWSVITEEEPSSAESCAKHMLGLFSLLVSGEVDADRADYMLRDGFHSSVTLGGFNLDHLLKSLHVGWSPDEQWMGLGITDKGLGALEDFVYSRYQMYRKVYGHKTSLGFDWLLRQAIDEVLLDSEARQYVDNCLSNMRDFQTLTDNFFWESFRRLAERKPDSFAHRLVYRRRLAHLGSLEDCDDHSIEVHGNALIEKYGLSKDALVACKIKARFSRIKPGFREIRVFDGQRYSDISDCSAFFGKFDDQVICHFFQL